MKSILILCFVLLHAVTSTDFLCKKSSRESNPNVACPQEVLDRGCNLFKTPKVENNETHIYIGVVGPFHAYSSWLSSSLLGLHCAAKEINESPTILPGVTIDFRFANSFGTQSGGFEAATCLQTIDTKFVVGPFYSGAATGAGVVGRMFDIPLIGVTTSLHDLSNKDPITGYPTFSRVFPSDRYQTGGLVEIMKTFGWKYVTLVQARNNGYAEGIGIEFSQNAVEAGITILNSISFDSSTPDSTIESMIDRVKLSGSRITIIAGYSSTASRYMKLADKKGMIGDGWVYMAPDGWARSYIDGLAEGLISIGPKRMTVESSPALAKLNACYESDVSTAFGGALAHLTSAGTGAPYSYDALTTFGHAIHSIGVNTALTHPNETVHAIHQSDFLGASGQINLDDSGELETGVYSIYNNLKTEGEYNIIGEYDRQSGTVTLNSDVPVYFGKNGKTTIAPDLVIACSVADGHYNISVSDTCTEYGRMVTLSTVGDLATSFCEPIEPYYEPCDYATISNGAASFAFFFALIGSIFFLSILTYMSLKWNHMIIKRGQKYFLFLMVVGALIVQLPALVTFNYRTTNTSCTVTPILLSIGATLMFGTIFLKIWRVNTILNNPTLKKVKITDRDLFFRLTILMGVVFVLDLLLILVSPPKVGRIEYYNDKLHLVHRYECVVDDSSITNLFIFLFALLMGSGCYMSYKTRNVTGDISESKWVFLATYNCTLCALVGIGAVLSLDLSGVGIYVLSSICTTLAALGVVGLIMLPKFYMIHYNFAIQPVSSQGAATRMTSNNVTKAANTKIVDLEREVLVLREKLRTAEKNKTSMDLA